jgi:hypothetical protein
MGRRSSGILEIGRKLVEVKDCVGYAGFVAFVTERLGWSERAGNNFVSITPRARRATPLPASHRCRPAASQGACDAVDPAQNTPSTADEATKSRPRSSVRRQLRRPAQPLLKTPPHNAATIRLGPDPDTIATVPSLPIRPPGQARWRKSLRFPSSRRQSGVIDPHGLGR